MIRGCVSHICVIEQKSLQYLIFSHIFSFYSLAKQSKKHIYCGRRQMYDRSNNCAIREVKHLQTDTVTAFTFKSRLCMSSIGAWRAF